MKKRIVYFILALIMVFSLPLSAASAQSDPITGTLDEDGDLVVEGIQPAGSAGEGMLPGALDLSNLPGGGFSTDEVIGVNAVPVSPVSSAFVKDKTPTFTFSKDGSASLYQIEVWKASNATLVYKFKGSGDCGATQCSLTPATKLKTYIYDGTRGYYAWRVRSKTGDSWTPFSGFQGFFVLSKGFTSTFDTHHKNWLAVYGDWFRVDPGYLKTKGVFSQFTSVMQQEFYEDHFVYEVTMKRKVKDNAEVYSNRIYFLGNTTGDVADGWDNGYEFGYYEDGAYFLYVRNADATTLLASGSTTAINPYGWNKLTVYTDYPWLDFWINGQYLGYTYIADDAVKYTQGFVGVAGYKGIKKTALLVDKAKLYYSSAFPYPITASVDGVRDPAYELKIDPNITIPQE